ncbi:MAG TPA: DUF4230 domain-containing protein [Anaerolineales bacterium]
MKTASTALLIVAVLVLLGAVGVAWFAIQQTASPLRQLSGDLGTEVARILHPTPTILPDPVTVVREVRSLARLETIQYSLEKVITAETGQGPFGFLFGDRLLFVAHGVVIAGVDLAQLAPDDVEFDDFGRIILRLPEAEIFIATLDNEKSYVYDRDTGLLRRGDVELESAARRAAETALRQAALDDGILKQAQANAEAYLYRLLRTLGYPDVIFEGPAAAPRPTATSTPIPIPSATP